MSLNLRLLLAVVMALAIMRCAGRAYQPRFLWTWPNAKISVMGGEQAARVLAQIKDEQLKRQQQSWDEQQRIEFIDNIREQYERQGNAFYATARLWDDGVINPLATRRTLGLAISAALNAPIQPTQFGIFRM